MSGSHKEFPKKAVFIQLGLATLVGIGFLFADKPAVHALAEKVTKPIVAAAAKVLAPIGIVEVKEAVSGSVARSGEEIYASTCGVCHDNGVAGAPKLDDMVSWETRLSGGFTALVTSAINGKGGMPARGGDPDITDSEMELVVSHMIKEAGIELVARSANAASPAIDSEQKPAVASTEEVTPEVKPVAEETNTKTNEKPDETATKTEEKSVVEVIAEDTKAEVVEKTEQVSIKIVEKPAVKISVEEAKDSIVEKSEELTIATEEKPAIIPAETNTLAIEKTDEINNEIAAVDYSVGEAVYKSSCFACHDSGVAGSPVIGKKDIWAERIALSTDTLYESAIKGKGAMPAKGGSTNISDEDVKAAVDYMIYKSM